MSNSDRTSMAIAVFVWLYMMSVGIAALYFNWEFARNNGFLRWVAWGEIVPTAKALAWPYFAYHKDSPTNLGTRELKRTGLTQQQIAETEIKKFILAINYSQQAAYLLNSTPHEHLEDYPNLKEIVAYRRKAIDVGRSTDMDALNSVYPTLGDKFNDQFIKAMCLFVHGSDTYSDDELHRSKLLNDEWADWYQANRKAIEDASNVAIGAH